MVPDPGGRQQTRACRRVGADLDCVRPMTSPLRYASK